MTHGPLHFTKPCDNLPATTQTLVLHFDVRMIGVPVTMPTVAVMPAAVLVTALVIRRTWFVALCVCILFPFLSPFLYTHCLPYSTWSSSLPPSSTSLLVPLFYLPPCTPLLPPSLYLPSSLPFPLSLCNHFRSRNAWPYWKTDRSFSWRRTPLIERSRKPRRSNKRWYWIGRVM